MKQTDEGRQMIQAEAAVQIDALIDRRSEGQGKATAEEELRKEEVRKYHAKRRETNRLEWIRYCYRMQYSHQQLADEYRGKVEELLALGEGAK
jgi:hypothetical protein